MHQYPHTANPTLTVIITQEILLNVLNVRNQAAMNSYFDTEIASRDKAEDTRKQHGIHKRPGNLVHGVQL